MKKEQIKRGMGGTKVLGVVGAISIILTLGVSADTVISVSWSGDQRAVMESTDIAGVSFPGLFPPGLLTNGAPLSTTPR